MTASEVVAAVIRGAQTDRIDDGLVWSQLDNALLYVTRAVRFKALRASASLTTVVGASSVAMPTDYHHSLYAARSSSDSKELKIFFEKEKMREHYGINFGQSGLLDGCCVEGSSFFYCMSPSAATAVEIDYYKKPTSVLTLETAVSVIPEEMQNVLVHYVLWRFFDIAEDFLDNKKENTSYHFGQMQFYLSDLRRVEDNNPKLKIPLRRVFKGGLI